MTQSSASQGNPPPIEDLPDTASPEAPLVHAREARNQERPRDTSDLLDMVESLRTALSDMQAQLGQLETMLSPDPRDGAASAAVNETGPAPTPGGEAPAAPRTIEVIVHGVRSPALARSVRQFLIALDGVRRAEVRELAEGVLRVTVDSTVPVTPGMLTAWAPERNRTVRTSTGSVVELALEE